MDAIRHGKNPSHLVLARRVDRPEPGLFKVRQARGGTWAPASIWWDDTVPDRPRLLMAEVNGIGCDVDQVWLWGRKITEDEHHYITAHHEWVAMVSPETLAIEDMDDMNINDTYPSKYLRAADLKGRTIRFKIARIAMEPVEKDKPAKPVMYFTTESGKAVDRGMVLNKTNAMSLSHAMGDETDVWVGKTVELFEAMVQFQSQMVPALRMRPIAAAARVAAPRTQPVQPAYDPADDLSDPMSDDIPFN